jgi:hypothetical protein
MRSFILILNVKINQLNSVKYSDARDDAHVCIMTRLIILGCYSPGPATMPREARASVGTRSAL